MVWPGYEARVGQIAISAQVLSKFCHTKGYNFSFMNHALYCNFVQSVMMSTVAPSQTYSAVCVLLLKLIFMITLMHSANQG